MRPLFFAVTLILAATTHAQESISGAFGYELGQVYDHAKDKAKGQLTNGTPLIYVYTPKPIRSLDDYVLFLTPKSGKIYSIWAQGSFDDLGKCKKERDVLLSVLEQKYGKAKEPDLTDAMLDARTIDQGARYVLAKCAGFGTATLELRYYDRDLEKLAEKERIELEAQKIDASGL